MSGTLSCSTNCFAVWAVTSILYWLSWTMKSIWLPSTPPAALISFTASFAPLAAGRSSADSSPVRAKPPPILIVPPVAPLAGALAGAPVGAVVGADVGAVVPPVVLHATATSATTAASTDPRATWMRINASSTPCRGHAHERTGAA